MSSEALDGVYGLNVKCIPTVNNGLCHKQYLVLWSIAIVEGSSIWSVRVSHRIPALILSILRIALLIDRLLYPYSHLCIN